MRISISGFFKKWLFIVMLCSPVAFGESANGMVPKVNSAKVYFNFRCDSSSCFNRKHEKVIILTNGAKNGFSGTVSISPYPSNKYYHIQDGQPVVIFAKYQSSDHKKCASVMFKHSWPHEVETLGGAGMVFDGLYSGVSSSGPFILDVLIKPVKCKKL